MLNAIESIASHNRVHGEVVVTTRLFTEEKKAHYVQVNIKDNGTGLSEDQCKHAFDPFYTTKATGKGTGLGLYVSYVIIEGLRGSITVKNSTNEGADVEILLPIVESCN